MRCVIPIFCRSWICQRIPLYAKDRTMEDPIVIGGGPCTYNPEPLADFFDLFYIGEGETSVLMPFWICTKNGRTAERARREFLEMAAEIPGIYVPIFV